MRCSLFALCVAALFVSTMALRSPSVARARQSILLASSTNSDLHSEDYDSSGISACSSSDLARQKNAKLMEEAKAIAPALGTAGEAPVALAPEYMSSTDILAMCADTEAGITASVNVKRDISKWVAQKEQEEQGSATRSSFSALLGNYEVSFVSAGATQTDRGNPVGGKYRGRLGRLLYTNTGLYQHILPSAAETVNGQECVADVVNYVTGNIASCLPFSVVLYGHAIGAAEVGPLAVKAIFRSPLLAIRFGTALLRLLASPFRALSAVIGTAGTVKAEAFAAKVGLTDACMLLAKVLRVLDVTIKAGPASTVVLDTPYVDSVLRVGRGSRGSEFLFRRINAESKENINAEKWRAVVDRRPLSSSSIAVALSGIGIYQTLKKRPRLGLSLGVVGVLLSMWKGGIEDDFETAPQDISKQKP